VHYFPGWYFLYVLAGGWCIGIALQTIGVHESTLLLIGCALLVWFSRHIRSAVLIVCALCGGYTHMYAYDAFVFGPQELDARQFVFEDEGEVRVIRGVVISKPVIVGSSYEFQLRQEEVGRMMVIKIGVKKCNCQIEYGDVVEVTGRANYGAQKYFKKRIFIELRGDTLSKIGINDSWNVKLVRALYRLRSGIVARIDLLYISPRSNLLSGLIIEGGASVPADLKKQFNIAGLSHIVALSGFNVAIVIEAVFFLLAYAGRRTRIVISMSFIVLFGVMTGLSSPIVRASIMAGLGVVAQLLYRRYHALRALVISGLIMIFWNPLYLTEDVSFQLSIAATLGLIAGNSLIGEWLERFPRWTIIGCERVRETLSTTLSAQLFVLPLIAAYMGSVSLVAPLSNTLALPAVPFAMLFGFLSVCVSYVPGVVGTILTGLTTFVGDVLLRYLLLVTRVTAELPFASVRMRMSLAVAIICMSITGAVLIWLHDKRRRSAL
jgi:competence protein ComEC